MVDHDHVRGRHRRPRALEGLVDRAGDRPGRPRAGRVAGGTGRTPPIELVTKTSVGGRQVVERDRPTRSPMSRSARIRSTAVAGDAGQDPAVERRRAHRRCRGPRRRAPAGLQQQVVLVDQQRVDAGSAGSLQSSSSDRSRHLWAPHPPGTRRTTRCQGARGRAASGGRRRDGSAPGRTPPGPVAGGARRRGRGHLGGEPPTSRRTSYSSRTLATRRARCASSATGRPGLHQQGVEDPATRGRGDRLTGAGRSARAGHPSGWRRPGPPRAPRHGRAARRRCRRRGW